MLPLSTYKMLIEFEDKKCPCDSYCPLCSFHEQGCYIGRYFLSIILQIYCSSKCLIYLGVENILWGRTKMFILQIFDWIFHVTHLYISIYCKLNIYNMATLKSFPRLLNDSKGLRMTQIILLMFCLSFLNILYSFLVPHVCMFLGAVRVHMHSTRICAY